MLDTQSKQFKIYMYNLGRSGITLTGIYISFSWHYVRVRQWLVFTAKWARTSYIQWDDDDVHFLL